MSFIVFALCHSWLLYIPSLANNDSYRNILFTISSAKLYNVNLFSEGKYCIDKLMVQHMNKGLMYIK